MVPQFLSTPSARRATDFGLAQYTAPWYFYPRPPRGGRLLVRVKVAGVLKFLSTPSARRATGDVVSAQHIVDISIHALREEGDLDSDIAQIIYKISIHALREEGDQRQPCIVAKLLYFYPRPPRGGRPSGGFAMGYVTKFLSTPSARWATCPYKHPGSVCAISIHALREEGAIHAYRA